MQYNPSLVENVFSLLGCWINSLSNRCAPAILAPQKIIQRLPEIQHSKELNKYSPRFLMPRKPEL